MKDSSAGPAGTYEFRTAPIGAGGFVIGLDISTDGRRMLHWADVFNGYIRDAGESAWKFLMRPDNLERREYDPRPKTASTDRGVFSARIAPSDRNRLYAAWNGFIFRSDDGAKSWRRTALPAKRMQSNMGPQRRFNRTIDVHPRNADQVIVGTNNDGVHATLDGGTSWSQIAVPAALETWDGAKPGKYLVAFDPGQPETVYVHVFGVGLYRSTQGLAGTFGLVQGSPAEASCLVVTPAGDVWICKFRTTNYSPNPSLFRMSRGGIWTSYDPKTGADQVAIDPFDPKHIVVVNENGAFRQSYDGGTTWLAHKTYRGEGEIQWLSNRVKPMYPAHILFDPVERGKLWMAEGVGICWSNPPTANNETWTWHDHSQGNEELVSTSVFSGPDNPVPLLTFWDKPLWRLENDREWKNSWSYPVPAGEAFGQGTVTIGHNIDHAIDDPHYLAACVGMAQVYNGYSEDYGKTWHKFPGLPPGGAWKPGGCIAVSNRDNIVVVQANNGPAVYTLNGGMTWNHVAFGGHDPVTHLNNAYYVARRNLASDKTRPSVFALLVNNIIPNVKPDTLGRDIAGLWLTTDGGISWTRKFAGLINVGSGAFVSTGQFWQARLEYVPGFTRELLYADGEGGRGNKLLWSRDDGESWTDVHQRVRTIHSFGFGKAAPGQSRPSVFFMGTVNGVTGVHASYDWFATTPILLSRFPNRSIDGVACVGGDLHRFGRCYVGFNGSGFALGDFHASRSQA